MATSVKIKLNHSEIQQLLNGGQGVDAMLRAKAERVLSSAVGSAPVDTGAYRAGLHIEETHTDRLVVRVAGSTDHDWIVEARTGNLARALDAAGGD